MLTTNTNAPLSSQLREAAESTWLLVTPSMTDLIRLLNEAADEIDSLDSQLERAYDEIGSLQQSMTEES